MELFIIRLMGAYALSFVFAYKLIPIFCAIAFKYNIVDKPDGLIKKHKKATPYLGGLAIYVSLLITSSFLFPFENHYFLLFVGATLLLFAGLIDDLMVLSPGQKFLAQMVAVFGFLRSGLYLKTHFFNNMWSIIFSAGWCLTIINAFNLIDVMDGLATTVAALITGALLLLALYIGHHTLVLLLTIFLGALCAFLCFNRPPASIYLGDAGSLFLGGFLAPIPFLFNWGTYNWYGYISPIIIFAVPLLEVAGLVLIRTYKKIPFYVASPDHFCLYLQKKGWSIKDILCYVKVLMFIQFLITFLFLRNSITFCNLIIISLLLLLFWIIILCKSVPFKISSITLLK